MICRPPRPVASARKRPPARHRRRQPDPGNPGKLRHHLPRLRLGPQGAGRQAAPAPRRGKPEVYRLRRLRTPTQRHQHGTGGAPAGQLRPVPTPADQPGTGRRIHVGRRKRAEHRQPGRGHGTRLGNWRVIQSRRPPAPPLVPRNHTCREKSRFPADHRPLLNGVGHRRLFHKAATRSTRPFNSASDAFTGTGEAMRACEKSASRSRKYRPRTHSLLSAKYSR